MSRKLVTEHDFPGIMLKNPDGPPPPPRAPRNLPEGGPHASIFFRHRLPPELFARRSLTPVTHLSYNPAFCRCCRYDCWRVLHFSLTRYYCVHYNQTLNPRRIRPCTLPWHINHSQNNINYM